MVSVVRMDNERRVCLEFGGRVVEMEENEIDWEIRGRVVGGERGRESVIKENKERSVMVGEGLIFIRVVVDLKGLWEGSVEMGEME